MATVEKIVLFRAEADPNFYERADISISFEAAA
jgi:hypothetical protein